MFKRGLTQNCLETIAEATNLLKEQNFEGKISDQEYLSSKTINVSMMQILTNQMDLSEQLSELQKSVDILRTRTFLSL